MSYGYFSFEVPGWKPALSIATAPCFILWRLLMGFVDIFDTDTPRRILDEHCSRAKPGADRINYRSFKRDFDASMPDIKSRIATKKYKFTKFEVMLKVKKHYKLPRLIFKSTMRDRLVAKLMTEYMHEFYKEIKYSPVKTRDVVLSQISNAIKESYETGFKYKYYLRLDISNYFDSINRHLLKEQLNKDGFDTAFMHLVDKLFFTMDLSMDRPSGNGVPQGISVSSVLAERYLRELDEKYNDKKYEGTVRFFRYVDDILVLTSEEDVHKQIKRSTIFELQSKYGLAVNPDKIEEGKLDFDTMDFLGIRIMKRKLTVSNTQFDRIIAQLDDLFMWYRRVSKSKRHLLYPHKDRALEALIERLNLMITGYKYTNSKGQPGKYGWIHTSLPPKIDDIEALKDLDKHIGFMILTHIRDAEQAQKIDKERKSFYVAFHKIKFSNNEDGYILDRDKASDEEMYRIVRNLSAVDVKYGLGEVYDKEAFEEKVEMPLRVHFNKTLYIANRELTSDILYW